MSHITANLTYTEAWHEPNQFTILTNNKWLMSIQHNGEQLVEVQRENMRRMVACWNACELMPTKDIEELAEIGQGVINLTVFASDMNEERDKLLEALQAIVPFIPITSAAEGGAAKYSEAVKAADLVRAAVARATGGAA
jgi:hypothetical protein